MPSVRIEDVGLIQCVHGIYNAFFLLYSPPPLDYTVAWLAYFIDVACIAGLVLLFIESMREQEVVEEAIKDLTGGEPADPVESILRYIHLLFVRGGREWRMLTFEFLVFHTSSVSLISFGHPRM